MNTISSILSTDRYPSNLRNQTWSNDYILYKLLKIIYKYIYISLELKKSYNAEILNHTTIITILSPQSLQILLVPLLLFYFKLLIE